MNHLKKETQRKLYLSGIRDLLQIIKQKGDCNGPVFIDCNTCLICPNCSSKRSKKTKLILSSKMLTGVKEEDIFEALL